MRIELLRKREAFEDIFARSLEGFLREYSDWSGAVSWAAKGATGFNSNDYLNVVYHQSLPRNELYEITQEFSWHARLSRRVLQRAYVHGAVRMPLERIWQKRVLVVEPCPDYLKKWVFVPGNHSIRSLDTCHQTCRVFPKIGFNFDFLRAEISVRNANADLSSPELVSSNMVYPWYEEERVTGMPLNRLGYGDDYFRGVTAARTGLSRLYLRSRQGEPLDAYLKFVSRELEAGIKVIVKKWGDVMGFAVKVVQNGLLSILSQYSGTSITTVQSHGDFQPANILVSEENVWLIDWEYSQRRSISYDYFVFHLQSRFWHGLSKRLGNLDRSSTNMREFGWTGLVDERSYMRNLYVFLLEDLCLRVKENLSPCIVGEPVALNCWLNEVAQYVSSNSRCE